MDDLTIQEALPVFYSQYNLDPNGGVNEDHVTVVLMKGLTLYIPNFETRKKIVVLHDIHHLVTGYSARMKGEMETSAWELSTGCFNNWFALVINTYTLMMGLALNLPGVWKAWRVGKRTTNLYHKNYSLSDLMSRKVADLKGELGFLDESGKSSFLYCLTSFFLFVIIGALFSAVSVALIPFTLLYSIITSIRLRWKKS